LTIAGANCQAYGNDIADLTLEVSYQAKGRLNVRIYPKYLATGNATQYLIPADIVLQPGPDRETTQSTSDLAFEWSNEPSFQFQVTRTSSDEVLFSSYGHVIVFEDQFIEVVTNMVDASSFTMCRSIDWPKLTSLSRTTTSTDSRRIFTISVWELTTHRRSTPLTAATQLMGMCTGSSHSIKRLAMVRMDRRPRMASTLAMVSLVLLVTFLLESSADTLQAHGQEWLLRNETVTFRAIGGSFDLYFLSGQNDYGTSSALKTISQFQNECVGLPAMQMFWTFGFHQTR
jgi:alpha-glucosidase